MMRISVSLVEPGAVLAKPVYDGRGSILLARGVQLTSGYLQRLKDLAIQSIYIESPFGDLIDYENALSEPVFVEVMKNTRHLVKMLASPRVDRDLSSAKKSVEMIVEELVRNRGTLLDLSALHDYDEYTYSHCVSVCVLSIIIGMHAGLRREELALLGMGALLHDIGKTRIPAEITKKPGKLTAEEYAIMQQHTRFGYDLLRKNSSLLSAHVAFQHQEKYDGTGYPRGVKGGDIHLFGRIAAVADVYDALTSRRPYRQPLPGHKAYEYIWSQSGAYFDPAMVRHFCGTVAIYPNGSLIELCNGKKGLVVKQNAGWPLRPVVCVMEDNRVVEIIDLMDEAQTNLVIVA
ncbi:HD domain-containing protein [Heliobacterium gestii]|uniref:HD domain-containing protein n=1 Tax=Heliomicrobium gestii TaxID=2699 RepID=A0A845LKI3_HELGE|nr:HD-GYP domain-containing protein [Heliomicrobium gestii]MBM7868168.1 HD-GYP domain-containing protein (c-di-GMP phosphodiesterase class II) [Heliomicrobium gestii]MZP43366.1 HD domain-containing protein [Heliomicrobium gestii]